MCNYRRGYAAICALVVGLAIVIPAEGALVTFAGTGSGADGGTVSAEATFSISGNILTIVLTNTSSTPTANNGQVLTGVTWDFNPNLAGSLSPFPDASSNPSLTAGSDIWVTSGSSGGQTTYVIDNNTQLGGTWTSKTSDSTFASAGLGDYGYATTGANGLFAAGTMVGGKTGSANYGLVSASTYLTDPTTLPNGTGPQSLPLVENSITINFEYTGTDSFTIDRITGAKFLVGTNGAYFSGAQQPLTVLPEPASIIVWGSALLCAGLVFCRRRRAES
jgi:hypothetical protein